eukprot:Nitzschia sp. Nitz4//scaffold66_size103028//80219//81667//NITZ4_004509-RA/size103028-processed-gene-0.13-mRNA-1//1//CDS//3329556383//7486//frame0
MTGFLVESEAESLRAGLTNYDSLVKNTDGDIGTMANQGSSPMKEAPKVSYWTLLSGNRNYRYFITSYLITHLGEWLTYISSLSFIESNRDAHDEGTSRTAISILILVRLLPNVFLSPLGGTLADSLDRRKIMIVLDILGALCAAIFVGAYQMESVNLLYIASFLQQCISGLYVPCHSSMIPQLISNDQELKKATTLEGLTWSAMQAFGAAASGIVVALLGVQMCFIIDGFTYLLSAICLWLVEGSYQVTEAEYMEHLSLWENFRGMAVDGVKYLWSSYFGALVLLKGTSALAYGACDVLMVALAEEAGESIDERSNGRRIGILFSLVGLGCLIGPLLADPYIHAERPQTVQVSCVLAFGISAFGYLGWAQFQNFGLVCLFALIRAAGSSNIWIHSTILLQKFSVPQMLGRVLAADFAVALICESFAAFMCGVSMDKYNLDPHQVSSFLAVLTTGITICWSAYHLSGMGAGKYTEPQSESTSV